MCNTTYKITNQDHKKDLYLKKIASVKLNLDNLDSNRLLFGFMLKKKNNNNFILKETYKI